jgi:hypothetical protein
MVGRSPEKVAISAGVGGMVGRSPFKAAIWGGGGCIVGRTREKAWAYYSTRPCLPCGR